LRASKGIPDLLRAFARLADDDQRPVKLVIAGYPTQSFDLGELRSLAEALGIADRLVLDPRYVANEEVGELMDIARVVVFPYLNATQSGPLMIAYAFGRPVIATAVGSFPSVVKDGETGFLVPPAAPEALAAAMQKLVDDAGLAARMGAKAKEMSEALYSWDAVGRDVLRVLERATTMPNPPPGRGETR
jgi:glycosyltransferase involved in cell wall biosynthesis